MTEISDTPSICPEWSLLWGGDLAEAITPEAVLDDGTLVVRCSSRRLSTVLLWCEDQIIDELAALRPEHEPFTSLMPIGPEDEDLPRQRYGIIG